MKNLLTETEVTKVGMNHERDHLRVYLSSTRLIHKKDIRQLESAIAQQIFKGRMMQVKVMKSIISRNSIRRKSCLICTVTAF